MSKVISFADKKAQRVENKRRNFERILFANFLGSYSVLDDAGSIYRIELIDISESGCLFQVPWNVAGQKKFEKNDELKLRMYFTQTSYLPVIVHIVYGKEYIDENGQSYMQYGCEFDKSIHSWVGIQAFINFLQEFANHSVDDKGQSQQVFFL